MSHIDDAISQEVKRRVGAFLNSADFDPYYKKLHPFSWWILILMWAIAPFFFRGDVSRGAWRKLGTGDFRTRGLRRRYARLGKTGEVIFSYVLISNSALQHEVGVQAPAMVIANFNKGQDDEVMLEGRDKLAELSLGIGIEPQDKKVAKLLGDIDYRFMRRRYLPTSYTGGVQVIAFDLMVPGEFLPNEKLQFEVIPCIAEPGKRGLICVIPASLIMDVMHQLRPNES